VSVDLHFYSLLGTKDIMSFYKDISMTLRYTKLTPERWRNAVKGLYV